MATLRTNSLDGTAGAEVTTTNSADHGDAFDTVNGEATYTATAWSGAAGAFLDLWGVGGYSELTWENLAAPTAAVRAYARLNDPGDLDQAIEIDMHTSGGLVGDVAIETGFGRGVVVETPDTTVTLAAVDAIPVGVWFRIELVATASLLHARVFWDPENDRPSLTGVVTRGVTGDITRVQVLGQQAHVDELTVADVAWAVGLARINSADGADGEAVTTTNSADHGDPWGKVDDGIVYSSTAYTGAGSIRFGSGYSSGTGVAWNSGLQLADFAVRGHLRRDSTAESGHIAWANAGGGMSLTTGGGLSWAGLSLASGAVPADQWVRVEARRVGSTGHLEVYQDPQGTSPDVSTSGTITTDHQPQWWWERYGDGGIWWDELALADTGEAIGPIDLPEPERLAVGMPMFAD